MSDPIKFELSPESVRSIIDANIKTAVLTAMDQQGPQLIRNLVSNVLGAKVNRNYRDMPFMDAVIQDFLTEQVKAAMSEYLEANKDLLKAQIERAIKDSKKPVRYSTDEHPLGDGSVACQTFEPPEVSIRLSRVEAVDAFWAWREGFGFEEHFGIEEVRHRLSDEPIETVVNIFIEGE